jgi:hypothetical protein
MNKAEMASAGELTADLRTGIASPHAVGRMTSPERLTAADRPGVAQPVPERPVPVQPWGRILASVTLVVLVATVVWEWRMRQLELLPGDIDDSASFWVEQRRLIDTQPVPVAIVGDSRILFDTDLNRFETLTGVRPLQLALPGTNARPFLENLAADEDFKGLVLVGIAERSYFRDRIGLYGAALDRYKFESPADRSAFVLNYHLSKYLGFLDNNYRLSTLVKRLDRGIRKGTEGPYDGVWKVSSLGEGRQSVLWSRLERDMDLNAHARHFWALGFRGQYPDAVIVDGQKRTRDAVARIRARGGDVVFIRPPSAGAVLESENIQMPRSRGWDPLMQAAAVKGLHYLDDPVSRELFAPELSHLSAACSIVYTDSYVRQLARITDRVKLLPNVPPALTPNDCPDGRTQLDRAMAAAAK